MTKLFHSSFEVPQELLPLEVLRPFNLLQVQKDPKFISTVNEIYERNNNGVFYPDGRTREERELSTRYGLSTEAVMTLQGMIPDMRKFRDGYLMIASEKEAIDVKVIHHSNTHCQTTFADMNSKLQGQYQKEWEDLGFLFVWKYCDKLLPIQAKNPLFPYKEGDVFFWKAFYRGEIHETWQVPKKLKRKN